MKCEDVFLKVLNPEAVADRVSDMIGLRAVSLGVSGRLEIEGHGSFDLGKGGDALVLSGGVGELATAIYNGASMLGLRAATRIRMEPANQVNEAVLKKLFPETYAFRSRFDL